MQCSFNIVSRTSLEGVALFFLIDLRKRTLNESGRRSQDCHEPHPESSAGTAENDRGGDAGHVSGAYAGRGGDHQSLKG